MTLEHSNKFTAVMVLGIPVVGSEEWSLLAGRLQMAG